MIFEYLPVYINSIDPRESIMARKSQEAVDNEPHTGPTDGNNDSINRAIFCGQPNPKVGTEESSGKSYEVMVLSGQGADIRSLFFQTPDGTDNQSFFESVGLNHAIKKIDRAHGDPGFLVLWHPIRSESFHNIAKTIYENAAGVMLCYNKDNRKSFKCIEGWLRNMQQHRSDNPNHDQLNNIKILVGIKSGVVGEEESVPLARGKALAKEYDVSFREILLGNNVSTDTLLKEMFALLEERNSA